MNQNDWKNTFGIAPDSFCSELQQSLNMLKEDEPMKKRYKFTTVFALAALIIVLLAGAAFAATQFTLLDILPNKPSLNADVLISTDIVSVENEYMRVTVEEALYDGQSIAMLLQFTPLNTAKYELWLDGTMNPDSISNKESIQFSPLVNLFDDDSIVNNLYTMADHFQRNEDSSYSIWGWYDYAKPMGDTLEGELIITFSNEAGELLPSAQITAPLHITISPNTQTINILPLDNGLLGEYPFQLISGTITLTDAYGHFEIVTSENREYAIRESHMEHYYLTLLDSNGTEYPLRLLDTVLESGEPDTMRKRTYWGIMPKITEIPDSLSLQVGISGKSLGRIECSIAPNE